MATDSASALSPSANKTRRWLKLLLALLGSIVAALAALAFYPVKPDVPLNDANNSAPGGGSLRRPFPAMKLRTNNPTTEEVKLGRLLFFDPVLSGDDTQSCATCHHPDLGFSDGRFFSMGKGGQGLGPERKGGKVIRRSAPTLWNVAYNFKQFWDGRAEDLEEQAKFPIEAPEEMDQKPDELVKELKAIPVYVKLFDQAFKGSNGSAITFANVANALAAFERTLISDNSAFDRYAAGDRNALNDSQKRGLTLFRSLKTRCFECHGFPTFANPDFKVIGVMDLPRNILGVEPPPEGVDLGRAEIAGGKAYERTFKVPTLRNVALTKPYMHNGRFQTLREVVDFYASGGGAGNGLKLPNLDDKIRRFTLTAQERNDLAAFLEALTDESRKPAIPQLVPSGLPVVPSLKANRASTTPPRTPTPVAARAPQTLLVNAGQSIQAALLKALPGATIAIKPGVYHETLLVDQDRITIRGLTENGQRVVLDGQNKLTDAVITSSHDFTIEGLTVRDYTSNGVTVHGGKNVTFRDLEIHNSGLYGVYPVECRNVLIERVLVTGARDAAIYVGQSQDIVVRNNEVHDNVTGIEIENSVNALVENNYAHGNTGGILVFLLPNNPSKVGSDCRVVNNRVLNNNHPNFADPNAIVARVPSGVGVLIMAADRTEVARNEIRGNDSVGVAVISLRSSLGADYNFDVGTEPEGTRIHGNTLADNGRNPAGRYQGMNVDLFWDGGGSDNVWEQPGAKSYPAVLPQQHWPGFAQRAYARAFSLFR